MKKITFTLVFLSILTIISCKKKEGIAPPPPPPPSPMETVAPPPPPPPPTIAPEKDTITKN